jgi:hypothetical protein
MPATPWRHWIESTKAQTMASYCWLGIGGGIECCKVCIGQGSHMRLQQGLQLETGRLGGEHQVSVQGAVPKLAAASLRPKMLQELLSTA